MNFATKKAIQNTIDTRRLQTLLGICSGLSADTVLNDKEIAYLHTWIIENNSIINTWPASAIYKRIVEIKADGIITENERQDLITLLQDVSGNSFTETGAVSHEVANIPFDTDADIIFTNTTFCFTGEFIYGTHAKCERAILNLGADVAANVTQKLDYLVVGSRISDAWINTSYGRKIEKAMAIKENSRNLLIISEKQWAYAISDL